jgi:hypothetical protein
VVAEFTLKPVNPQFDLGTAMLEAMRESRSSVGYGNLDGF